jgi:hypothetical protein
MWTGFALPNYTFKAEGSRRSTNLPEQKGSFAKFLPAKTCTNWLWGLRFEQSFPPSASELRSAIVTRRTLCEGHDNGTLADQHALLDAALLFEADCASALESCYGSKSKNGVQSRRSLPFWAFHRDDERGGSFFKTTKTRCENSTSVL